MAVPPEAWARSTPRAAPAGRWLQGGEQAAAGVGRLRCAMSANRDHSSNAPPSGEAQPAAEQPMPAWTNLTIRARDDAAESSAKRVRTDVGRVRQYNGWTKEAECKLVELIGKVPVGERGQLDWTQITIEFNEWAKRTGELERERNALQKRASLINKEGSTADEAVVVVEADKVDESAAGSPMVEIDALSIVVTPRGLSKEYRTESGDTVESQYKMTRLRERRWMRLMKRPTRADLRAQSFMMGMCPIEYLDPNFLPLVLPQTGDRVTIIMSALKTGTFFPEAAPARS